MSTHFNSMFCTYTQGFIQQNFMTAFRIGVGGVPAGGALFDLHHHMVNRHQFVTLEIWTMMPLNSDEIPLISYWVPQGGSCLVPARPARTYVFTPDFSGCSILVDQIDPNWYKVYHVQGGVGHLQQEYLAPGHLHGLGLAGSMTFDDDYGNDAYPCGFAFLKYEDGRWWIYYQRQNGAILGFQNGQFIWQGPPPAVLGGARIPVADLRSEIPRLNTSHSGCRLPVARNIQVQHQMLPDNKYW